MGKKQIRRRYTDEFKNQAVLLAKNLGRTAAARQLEISVRSLENWINSQGRAGAVVASRRAAPSELEAELSRLRAENATLKIEREILKKAAAFFAKESK